MAIKNSYGAVKDFYSVVELSYRLVKDFYRAVKEFYGAVELSYVAVEEFYGDVNNFYSAVSPYAAGRIFSLSSSLTN